MLIVNKIKTVVFLIVFMSFSSCVTNSQVAIKKENYDEYIHQSENINIKVGVSYLKNNKIDYYIMYNEFSDSMKVEFGQAVRPVGDPDPIEYNDSMLPVFSHYTKDQKTIFELTENRGDLLMLVLYGKDPIEMKKVYSGRNNSRYFPTIILPSSSRH